MSPTTHVMTQAAHALRKSSHPALRRLHVEGIDNGLVIKGQVGTYFLKQMAQETILPLRGEYELYNHVDVVN